MIMSSKHLDTRSTKTALLFDIFDSFLSSVSVKHVLERNKRLLQEIPGLKTRVSTFDYFKQIKSYLEIKPNQKYDKIHSILHKLEKRSLNKSYLNNSVLNGLKVLVIGGGISGLRVSIELLLLGAKGI